MKALWLKTAAWLSMWSAPAVRVALLKDLNKALTFPNDALAGKAAYDAGAALWMLAAMAPAELAS